MANVCSECGKNLIVRSWYEHDGKKLCKRCLNAIKKSDSNSQKNTIQDKFVNGNDKQHISENISENHESNGIRPLIDIEVASLGHKIIGVLIIIFGV